MTGKSNAVYGGYTIDGNASGNIVNIEDDADIHGEIMGGYTRAGSLISGNKVNVTGGNVNENTVYGAYTETSLGFASAGSADVTNNEVAISGGSGVAEVYGGRSYSGLAQGNKVTRQSSRGRARQEAAIPIPSMPALPTSERQQGISCTFRIVRKSQGRPSPGIRAVSYRPKRSSAIRSS